MPVDSSTYQKYYNALQQAYGKDGTVEKGAFNLGYDDFKQKLSNQEYAQKIYGALNQAYGKQGTVEKGAFTLPFQDFYGKVSKATSAQSVPQQPVNVSTPPDISDIFRQHAKESTAIPAIGMPALPSITSSQQHSNEVQRAANNLTQTFNNNKDKAINSIILDNRRKEQDRINSGYANGYLTKEQYNKSMQDFYNKVFTDQGGEVANFKQSMSTDPNKVRQVVDVIAKSNPDKANQLKADMYLMDSQHRPENANLILQNAHSIANNKGIDYDIKRGNLKKNEGFFESLGQGFSERNRMMKDYDFYSSEAPKTIIDRLEQQRASYNPDLPVNVPYGIGGHLGQAIGSQGIVTAKGAIAGAATSLVPGVGEIAAPWVAAAATSPEFYKLGYVSSLENEYHQLRNAGIAPEEALQRAKDKASFDAKVDVAQGAISTAVGTRIGIKPGEFSPTFTNSIKNIAVHSGKWLTETGVEGGANAIIAGGLQELKNIHAGKPAGEGVFETGMGQLMFAYGLGALTKGGRVLLNPKAYRSILQTMARAPEKEINTSLASMVKDGSITEEEANDIHSQITQQHAADSKIPPEVANDKDRSKIQDMIAQRDALEAKMEVVDKAYHPELKEQIKAINEKIADVSKNPSEPSVRPSTEPTFVSPEDQQRLHDNEIISQLKPPDHGKETEGDAQTQEIGTPEGAESPAGAASSIHPESWARTLDYGENKGKEENKAAQDKIKEQILNDEPIGGTGERFSQLLGRVIPGIEKVMAKDPHNTTVVTHSSVIKALKVWEEMGRPKLQELTGEKLKEFAQKYVDLKPEAEGKVHTFKSDNGNEIKIVRHGETEDNKLSEFRTDDTQLTDKGIAQAKKAGENLVRETGGNIPKIISSDLPRTVHTSKIIGDVIKEKQGEYPKITNVKLKENASNVREDTGQLPTVGQAGEGGQEVGGHDVQQVPGQPPERPSPEQQTGQRIPQEESAGEKAAVPLVKDEDWPFVEEPEDNEVTSLKNAVTAQKVEDAGLMPAMKEAKREFGQVWDEAQKKLAKGYDVEGLLDNLKKKPRPITDLENAMILYHQNVKESQKAQAEKELNEARASSDRQAWNEAYNTRAKLLDDLQKIYDVDKAVGTANARGLNARKMMADRRFSLVNMQAEKRASNGGEPLTDKQLEEVQKQFEDIKKAKDAYEAKVKDLQAENDKLKQQQQQQNQGKSTKVKGKELADRIRTLKINKGDKAQANLLSIPVAVYDGAISAVALAVENGAKLVEAIEKGVDYIKAKHGFEGPEQEKAFRDQFENIDNPEKTIAERYEDAKNAVKKRIENLREQIVKGEERVRAEKKPLNGDVELNRLREEAKTLNDLLNKYKPVFDKYADQRQLTSAKKKLTNEINDLNNQINNKERTKTEEKKEITDKELETMKSIRDAKKALLDQIVPIEKKARTPKTEAERLETYKENVVQSKLRTEMKTRTGDFSKKTTKPLALDKEAIRLRGEYEKAKSKYELGLKKDQLAQRTKFQKTVDAFTKWERAFKLSNPVTLAKLSMAAITRLAQTPVEEGIGGVYSAIIPELAKRAEGEGGVNVKSLAKAYKKAFTTGMKDAYDVLKSGKSNIDYALGKGEQLPPEAIDFFGQLHGSIKAPVKRFAFERSLEKRLSRNIANGVDVTDPEVQTRILTDSYKDAQRAIFMQDNFVSKHWQQWISSLERSAASQTNTQLEKGLSKGTAAAMQFLVPFVKVPTNIVGETGTHALGLPIAGTKVIHTAFTKGLSELTPNEADFILRNMKKGTLGAGALLLGYFRPDLFGGYYQQGEKRKEGELKAGEMNVGGLHVPAWLLESPIFQTMQLGATIRKAKDKVVKGEEQGIGEGIWSGGLGLVQHEPLIDQPVRMSKLFGRPAERDYYLGELAKSTVDPALLDWAAKITDPEEKRKPTTILEHIKTGIPGLRETVPTKKETEDRGSTDGGGAGGIFDR